MSKRFIKIKGLSSICMPQKTHMTKVSHVCSNCKCIIYPGQNYRKTTAVERKDTGCIWYHTKFWCLDCSNKELRK